MERKPGQTLDHLPAANRHSASDKGGRFQTESVGSGIVVVSGNSYQRSVIVCVRGVFVYLILARCAAAEERMFSQGEEAGDWLRRRAAVGGV